MDPVPLDPGDHDGTYKLVGGEASLDFINTLSWPGTDREHDWLVPVENVALWAVAVDLIDEQQRARLNTRPQAVSLGETDQLRQIRHNLGRVLVPLAHGEPPAAAAVETLNEMLEWAGHRRRIDPDTLRWTWERPDSLHDLSNPIVWNAAHVMTSLDHNRLGHCPSCHWIFYDTSRNRSRRWCDMADCGSRDKALRYYHRTKQAAGK